MSSDEDYSAGSSIDQPYVQSQSSGSSSNGQAVVENRVIARGKYGRTNQLTKEMFITHYEEGLTIAESAKRTGININTAKSIIRLYKKNDGCRNPNRRPDRNYAKKLTDEAMKSIEKYVEENPGITLKNIQTKLRHGNNILLSQSSIHNGLVQLKITLKLASKELEQMNAPRTIGLRKIYAQEYRDWAHQSREKLIFVDESGYNLHLRRSKARSRRGTKAVVVMPKVRGRNVTAMMTTTGILHYKVLANSNCNSQRFCEFLRELAEKVVDTTLQNGVLIMDNAAIHKTQEVRDLLAETALTLKYLPPYSPMMNPIENCFSKMKFNARQVLADTSEDHLVDVIVASLQTIEVIDAANYVAKMEAIIPNAANGEILH